MNRMLIQRWYSWLLRFLVVEHFFFPADDSSSFTKRRVEIWFQKKHIVTLTIFFYKTRVIRFPVILEGISQSLCMVHVYKLVISAFSPTPWKIHSLNLKPWWFWLRWFSFSILGDFWVNQPLVWTGVYHFCILWVGTYLPFSTCFCWT